MTIKELKEQLQEDVITILDGENEEMIDAICQVIVDRVNQFVDLIGSDMGMTSQQIDQLWELAKTL